MKKLYELNGGDTFYFGGVNWRICHFTGNHRHCRPVGADPDADCVAFHIDTEVQVYEF